MVDNKSKDDITTSTRSTEAANIYDTVSQNYIRIVDEFTKAQPQYTQSVSNLQLDCIAEQRILSKIWLQLKRRWRVTGTFL